MTGTYIAELFDVDNLRQVSASYTISASATWEKKTIIFPADTTGAFGNDNGRSLDVRFWLGGGTNFTSGTLNTTWAAETAANRAVGQLNLAATLNNYWQVTGVQLEAGSVATPFEFEDISTTLAKCQRYYQRTSNDATNSYTGINGVANSATIGIMTIIFPVPMRVKPTSTDFNSLRVFDGTNAGTSVTAVTVGAGSSRAMGFDVTASSLTAYRYYYLIAGTPDGGYIGFSAEL
jgi:hypothetical protein